MSGCVGLLAHLRNSRSGLTLLGKDSWSCWNLSKRMLELTLVDISFGILMILNGLFSSITESVSVVVVCCLFNLCTVVTVDIIADCTNSLILFASCWSPGVFSYSGNANLNINSLSSLTPNRVRAFVDCMWKSGSLSNSCDKDWSIHLANTRAIGILLWITVNKISDAYQERENENRQLERIEHINQN